jgi:hypothetical protein
MNGLAVVWCLPTGGEMASEQRPVQKLSPDAVQLGQHGARLRTAFALHESGVALKRAQLRRQHADESDEELARRLAAWLQERPGATHGDSAGVLGQRSGLTR